MENHDSEDELMKLPQPTNFIDKMTMELLMNKTQYKKYVSMTDPKKFSENQAHLEKIEKYSEKIMELTNTLLEKPDTQISNEVDESFDDYVRTLIKHFEIKEIENPEKAPYNSGEDVLFDPVAMTEPTKSYWGKQRVLKQDYFTKGKK